MNRTEIINRIGLEYYNNNTETGEFSYTKALRNIGKNIADYQNPSWRRRYKDVDIRFYDNELTVLVETKDNYDRYNIDEVYEQLNAYVIYEKQLTTNNIVAMVANTEDDRIIVFYGKNLEITNNYKKNSERVIKSFSEYKRIFSSSVNNKIKVIQSTYSLNEMLNELGINEKIRSQFVGTCLLALKNNLNFEGLSNAQIRTGIEEVLTQLLDRDLNKAMKLTILKSKVLDSQNVKELSKENFQKVLLKIKNEILPFINDSNTQGQDLLNLFFTTFNKYVGKDDKNQAFTPDHIVHFMCKVTGVNRNSYVLDPCCGSGAFLVRALTEARDDCDTDADKEDISKRHIYGIEYEEGAFGLSTTNMLIHGDGNSNVIQGSCFKDLRDCIGKKDRDNNDIKINVVLMNPPYNATRNQSEASYAATWSSKTKTDPSKGFHFVYYIANKINNGKLAVLLPMACAIGSDKETAKFKELMLEKHNLEAVFSLPGEMFHPGSTSKACCMVFNLGIRHERALNPETFFGYYKNDGFVKKKNLGRVEKVDENGIGVWKGIEEMWLDLYTNRKTKAGYSVVKKVTSKDEWLAEAYMETDYSVLNKQKFIDKINDYLAFKCLSGKMNFESKFENEKEIDLNVDSWGKFKIDINSSDLKGLFELRSVFGETTDLLTEGNDVPYIAAKNDINGFKQMCSSLDCETWISDGNCVVFIQLGDGSAGYTTYQAESFIGMNGKIGCGYNPKMNVYSGLFISTVLDLERPKYSFGRSWTGDRLKNTVIKLPIKANGDVDWDYMEKYIKSLPFSNYL